MKRRNLCVQSTAYGLPSCGFQIGTVPNNASVSIRAHVFGTPVCTPSHTARPRLSFSFPERRCPLACPRHYESSGCSTSLSVLAIVLFAFWPFGLACQSDVMVLTCTSPMIHKVERFFTDLLAIWIFTFGEQGFLFHFCYSWKTFLKMTPVLKDSVFLFPPGRSFLSLGIWQFEDRFQSQGESERGIRGQAQPTPGIPGALEVPQAAARTCPVHLGTAVRLSV